MFAWKASDLKGRSPLLHVRKPETMNLFKHGIPHLWDSGTITKTVPVDISTLLGGVTEYWKDHIYAIDVRGRLL